MKSYCFGIDVGGTSVKCGLFNTDGTLLEKWEIPAKNEHPSVRIGNVEFTVLMTEERRIAKLRAEILPETEQTENQSEEE